MYCWMARVWPQSHTHTFIGMKKCAMKSEDAIDHAPDGDVRIRRLLQRQESQLPSSSPSRITDADVVVTADHRCHTCLYCNFQLTYPASEEFADQFAQHTMPHFVETRNGTYADPRTAAPSACRSNDATGNPRPWPHRARICRLRFEDSAPRSD